MILELDSSSCLEMLSVSMFNPHSFLDPSQRVIIHITYMPINKINKSSRQQEENEILKKLSRAAVIQPSSQDNIKLTQNEPMGNPWMAASKSVVTHRFSIHKIFIVIRKYFTLFSIDFFFFLHALVGLNWFYIGFVNEVCKDPWAGPD